MEKDYIKKFDTPSDGHMYYIEDIPFTSTVFSTGQDILCDKPNRGLIQITGGDVLKIVEISRLYLNDGTTVKYLTTNISSGKTNTYKTNLTGITIGDGVTNIGNNTFKGCTGLTSVNIPDSVTSIGNSVFYECSSLTSATIGTGVTSIGQSTFLSCTGLTSVNIPDRVTSIGSWAFYGCSDLTSIEIPSGVTTILEYTFAGCTGLTSITIPDSVTSIGNSVFYECSSLTTITYEGTVEDWGRISRNPLWHNGVPVTTVVQCSDNTASLDYVTPSS